MSLRFSGLAVLALSAAVQAQQPGYRPFGIDLTAQDPKVPAGQSFFEHANGAYLTRTPIPAEDSITDHAVVFGPGVGLCRPDHTAAKTLARG